MAEVTSRTAEIQGNESESLLGYNNPQVHK